MVNPTDRLTPVTKTVSCRFCEKPGFAWLKLPSTKDPDKLRWTLVHAYHEGNRIYADANQRHLCNQRNGGGGSGPKPLDSPRPKLVVDNDNEAKPEQHGIPVRLHFARRDGFIEVLRPDQKEVERLRGEWAAARQEDSMLSFGTESQSFLIAAREIAVIEIITRP